MEGECMEYGELSERMEQLFAEQVSDRAILTDDLFCRREALPPGQPPCLESGKSSIEKTAVIGGFKFSLLYVKARCLRHDRTLLFELGIRNPEAARYYELDLSPDFPYVRYLAEESYQRLEPEARKHVRISPFFNYFTVNPKAKSLEVNLHGKDGIPQKFHITPNLAPFCDNHFLVWPEPEGFTGLKQVYHEDMIYWIDDLFCRLESGYSLFFSAKYAGNSVDTFHTQVIRLPFPAFDYLDRYLGNTGSGLIETTTQAWPLPGVFARYNSATRAVVLAALDRYARGWLSFNDTRTFNLLFRKKAAEIREVFFIFRKKGFTRLSGINNEFAGSEAGGNIIIENREDYDRFPGKTERLELVSEAGQSMYWDNRQEVPIKIY
jgi:hypothetical protein